MKVGEEASTALTTPHPACRIADCVALLQRGERMGGGKAAGYPPAYSLRVNRIAQ